MRARIFAGGGVPRRKREAAGASWLCLGAVTLGVYLIVDAGIDVHFERAVAAGAEVVRALHDTDYGSQDYAVKDPEGNLWDFGTYRPAAVASAMSSAGE